MINQIVVNSTDPYYVNGTAGAATGLYTWRLDTTDIGESQPSESPVAWANDSKGNRIGISPILYFKYVKSKFSVLERSKLEKRLKKLEAALYEAIDNGQELLSKKLLDQYNLHFRETLIYSKGITKCINKQDLNKHKRSIRDGHISDTRYADYTRVIPKRVIDKKKKLDGLFDDFVIYHYYNADAKDLKALSADEKQKMKDPVLFGIINGSDNLYYIDEWDDDYCDLSFEEIVDHIGKQGVKKLTQEVTIA